MGQGFDPHSLGIVSIFMRADWVVQVVMVGLAIASLWSWVVILDKLFRFAGINKQAAAFEDAVASGRSLDDLANQAGDNPSAPMPALLVAALKSWRDARARGPLSDGQGAIVLSTVDRVLDSIIARESRRIEDGLGVLAIVATSSPFIGLFGTVWGIMHAFSAIAAQHNTNLATVAPAISEALFATALGLAAAIPAYIAYNKFSLDAAKFAGRLEAFADELGAAIARRIGERVSGAA
jgi:biopolymer transport protein TolQ